MSRLGRAAAVFAVLTLVSRLTGFVRNMVFTAVFGRGALADSYLLANNIPNQLYEFVAGGLLSAVLLPALVRTQKESGAESPEARELASTLLGTVALVLGVVSALAALFSPWVIQALTFLSRDSRAADQALATQFFGWFSWQIVFYGIGAVCMAILNARDRFAAAAASPILNNLLVILAYWAYGRGYIGVTGLAFFTTAGVAVSALVLLPPVLSGGLDLRPRFDFANPALRSVVSTGWPVMAIGVVNFMGTAFRSNLLYTDPGGTTTFTLSFQLVMTAYGILAVSIATVMYPAMARAAAENNTIALAAHCRKGMLWTATVMLPVVLGMAILAEPLVRAVFERGNFLGADTLVTARFLTIYAISVFPFALVGMMTRAFYAQGDTRTPAIVTGSGVVVSAVLGWWLLQKVGLLGVAYATLIGHTGVVIVYLVILHRNWGAALGLNQLARGAAATAVAGMAAAVVLLAFRLGDTRQPWLLARSVTAAVDAPSQRHIAIISESIFWSDTWHHVMGARREVPEINWQRDRMALVTMPVGRGPLPVVASGDAPWVHIAAPPVDNATSAAALLIRYPARWAEPLVIFGARYPDRFDKLHLRDWLVLFGAGALAAVVYGAVACWLGAVGAHEFLAKLRRRLPARFSGGKKGGA